MPQRIVLLGPKPWDLDFLDFRLQNTLPIPGKLTVPEIRCGQSHTQRLTNPRPKRLTKDSKDLTKSYQR